MNRLFSIAAMALIATSTISLPANAQMGWGINVSQAQLQTRINAGIRSGALTRSEAKNLQDKLNRITYLEARARASGFGLSPRERNSINGQLMRLKNDVQRQLTDSDSRYHSRFGRHFFR